jgi:hypothetical protein
VYSRLYDLAGEQRRKMEGKKKAREDEQRRELEGSRVRASYISQEMMRDRGAGVDNYGEMLYQESLEALQRRREKVGRGARPACGPPALWRAGVCRRRCLRPLPAAAAAGAVAARPRNPPLTPPSTHTFPSLGADRALPQRGAGARVPERHVPPRGAQKRQPRAWHSRRRRAPGTCAQAPGQPLCP